MRDGTAVIKVNGIEVGAMPVEQYEEIVRSVTKDWRVKVSTLLDSFRVYFKIGTHLFFTFVHSLGVMAAILMIACLFRPVAEVARFINEVQNATPEGLVFALRRITIICIGLSAFYYMAKFIYGGFPEHLSPTKIAICRKIREVMEVPAEGKVSVIFMKDGVYCVR